MLELTLKLFKGEGDDDNGDFTIKDGQLRTQAVLDRETKPTRSIRIQVKDSGGLTYEQAFTITIDNANDAPTGASRIHLLDENLPADSVVTTLGALIQTTMWVTPTRLASSRGRAR